jgi:plastocyanin domain-containing protein
MAQYSKADAGSAKRSRALIAGIALVAVIVVGSALVGCGAASGPSAASGPTQSAKGADGVLEVQLAIIHTKYVPQNLNIPADTPVRLIVDRQEAVGCSNQLWIDAAGVKAALTPNGVTKIDLPPMKAGVYQMTCQMRMMSGTLTVGGASN